MSTRLCKNCRHFVNDIPIPFMIKYGKCALTRKDTPGRVDPVDGSVTRPKTTYSYAESMRLYGECGPEGKKYEVEPDTFTAMKNLHYVPAMAFTKAVIFFSAMAALMPMFQ